jgi:hypothetical protein
MMVWQAFGACNVVVGKVIVGKVAFGKVVVGNFARVVPWLEV